jgi:4a-hydroxytetrahydrobiopterin dehydratase
MITIAFPAIFHYHGAMSSLHYDTCREIEPGAKPVERKEAIRLAIEASGWVVAPDTASISKQFHFDLFSEALAFVNEVGKIALAQKHLPEIEIIGYDVDIRFSTPQINGLSPNDFIMAARVNKLKPIG